VWTRGATRWVGSAPSVLPGFVVRRPLPNPLFDDDSVGLIKSVLGAVIVLMLHNSAMRHRC
jgi:hypothetical protein